MPGFVYGYTPHVFFGKGFYISAKVIRTLNYGTHNVAHGNTISSGKRCICGGTVYYGFKLRARIVGNHF